MESVKVANAEDRMVDEFRRLDEERRTATLRDILLTQALNSVFGNAASLGTGLILILAAGSMLAGSFTVGNFALFVSYLGMFGWVNQEICEVLTGYRRTGVSVDRLRALMRGTQPSALVTHGSVRTNGDSARVP